MKYKFDVNREDLYMYKKEHLRERTKQRLTRIAELGMSEVGIAQFGYRGIMSGLYIEKVWNYGDKEFDDYMVWAAQLIKSKINRRYYLHRKIKEQGYTYNSREKTVYSPFGAEERDLTRQVKALRSEFNYNIQVEIV